MKRFLIKTVILVGFLLLYAVAFESAAWAASPSITSDYYCLVDRESGQPILAHNANVLRPVASTTKMMTAILAVEYCENNEKAVVSKHADNTLEYTIGLRQGQEIKVGELLKAALVRSANDAAVVLAEQVAGDEEFFAFLMSKKAFAIGAMRTSFKNASGLPAKGHYSTAYDLTQIGRYALSKPYISALTGSAEVKFKHPGYGQLLTLHNTNSLLTSYPGADGIKTGTTNAAGNCLVASATRKDRALIAVVLKSANRTGDCARLLNYGFNSERTLVVDHKSEFKSLKLAGDTNLTAQIFPDKDLYLWIGKRKPNIEKVVRFDYLPQTPIPESSKLGELDIYIEGIYADTIDLINSENIGSGSNFWNNLIRKFFNCTKGNKA